MGIMLYLTFELVRRASAARQFSLSTSHWKTRISKKCEYFEGHHKFLLKKSILMTLMMRASNISPTISSINYAKFITLKAAKERCEICHIIEAKATVALFSHEVSFGDNIRPLVKV